MSSLSYVIESLFEKRRWLLHAFFWTFVLGFYVIFFGRKHDNYAQTLFFVGLLMPVTIGTTYLFNYYLVPRYLMSERYLQFLAYTVYLVLATLFVEMLVALLTFFVMAGWRIHDMSPASFDLFFILSSLLMVVFLGVAIKMVLHWRQSREDYQKLMRDKVETELKFLKTQLNPHFLFNTLNNLYFLSAEKSDKAPEAILALSEMLDYVLNAGKATLVPLSKEIQQVQHFISLELLRYEDRVRIDVDFSGPVERHVIAPMILVTLMENAFKHGVMPSAARSWIRFGVRATENQFEVTIVNSYQRTAPGKGIGLVNLRSQLDLLYRSGYALRVYEGENEFSVTLVLKAME
jgi:sensor histidine kinase YesM